MRYSSLGSLSGIYAHLWGDPLRVRLPVLDAFYSEVADSGLLIEASLNCLHLLNLAALGCDDFFAESK